MTSIRGSLALSVAILAFAGSGAHAADIYDGSIKDGYVAAPVEYSAPRSWYLRLDGSWANYDKPVMVEDHIYDLVHTDIGSSWSIGGGVGRYLGGGFRADLTYDYRFEADAHGYLQNHQAALDGTRDFGIKSHLLLANLYYDFNAGGRFSPYLGVGLGWARHTTTAGTVVDTCGCTATIDSKTKDNLAAALMAGVTINLTGGRSRDVIQGGSVKDAPIYVESNRGLLLDLGYRFLYLGDAETGPVRSGVVISQDPVVENIHAHEFRIGLRYNMN